MTERPPRSVGVWTAGWPSAVALLGVVAHESRADPCPVSAAITLTRDAPWSCEVALDAGSPYLLRVDQWRADLTVEVTDPDGRSLLSADSPTRRAGPELVLMTPQRSGRHGVELTVNDRGPREIRTEFLLAEQRDASSDVVEGLALVTLASAIGQANETADLAARLDQLQRAAEMFRAAGNQHLQAEARLRIMALHYWSADWQQAAAAATEAAASFAAIGDTVGKAAADTIRGAALIETTNASTPVARRRGLPDKQSPFREAEALLVSAAETFGRHGLAYFQAEAINHLGAAYFYQAEFETARTQFGRAVQILEGAREESVLPLQNLAVLDYDRGDYDRAIESYQRLLTRHDDHGDPSTRIAVLNNLGVACYVTGRTYEALTAYLRALQLSESLPDPSRIRNKTLHDLGVLYHAIGDEERATVFLQQALEGRRSKSAGDPRGLLTSLLRVGELHRERGQHYQALELHLEALELAGSLTDRGRALLAVAEDHLAAGKIETAQATADTAAALGLRPAWPLSRSIASTRAYATLRAGGPSGAAALLAAAQANLHAGDTNLAARDFHRLALTAYQQGSLDISVQYLQRAVDIYEDQRVATLSPDLRATYLALRAATYDLQTEILMQEASRANADERERLIERAVVAAEHRRWRTLREFRAIGPHASGLDDATAANIMQLDRQIAAKRHRLASTQDQRDPSAERIEDLQREIQLLRARLDLAVASYTSDIAIESPVDTPLSLASLREVIAPDSVVLTYLSGYEHMWLLGLTLEGIHLISLGLRADVEDRAHELQTHWSQRSSNMTPMGELEASRRILGSALEVLGNKRRLIVVADGPLRRLPFAALRVDSLQREASPRRLGETHVITYRATLNKLDEDEVLPSEVSANRRILLVGAPAFPPAVPGRDFTQDAFEFPPLSGARRELDAIAEIATDWEVEVLAGESATKAALLRQPMRSFRVVHFATHARLDVLDPQLSAIALTSVSDTGPIEDPMLSLREVLGLELSADAVVLSTCDSSLGKNYRAQTSFGLSEAFLLAGARRVLGSLWQVPDTATSEFMRALYSEYFAKGRALDDAVFRASRSMMSMPRFRHPYYWAAFVILTK